MEAIKDEYQSRVNRITYLASLVSEVHTVDPLLDDLRQLTSTWHDGAQLHDSERRTLDRLEGELKDHLINRDPLRSFTAESLEAQIHTYESGGVPRQNKRDFILILVASLGALIGGFVLAPATLPWANRLALALPIYMLIITVGITWFYLSGLKNFKPGVRTAFIYFCIAWALMSLLLLHYGIIQLFDLQQYALFKYAGLTILITLWMLFVFLGMRTYAGLLDIRSRFRSWLWLGGVVGVVVALVILAPHPQVVEHEFFFRLAMACAVPTIPLAAFSTVLAHKIRRILHSLPMTIMAYYLTAITVNCILGITALFFVGALSKEVLAALVGTGSLPQLVLLYTGYLFKEDTQA